ncbi:MAG: hypothetical protein H6867_04195 [Rhodospirillales bacterium]|nr:hypothetical protein [Rhodospirillales bacterium]MCB9996351.1 hypothetical protein [Rhodospirillales bacterium]
MTNHAELIASGIAGLQMATGQTLPEEGIPFNPAQARLSAVAAVKVVPLDGADSYTLEVTQDGEQTLAQAVQAGLDTATQGGSGPAHKPDNSPGL